MRSFTPCLSLLRTATTPPSFPAQASSIPEVNNYALSSSSRPSSCASHRYSDSVDSFARFASLLARIQPESITAMALRIHQEWSPYSLADKITCTLVSPPLCGSFNLIHVLNFSDGVRWVLRIPLESSQSSEFCTTGRRLESEVMTIHFIRKNTTIPIPDIIKFDPNCENEIASPYMMMKFAEGSPVCQLWWDKTGPTPLEERRHRILDNISSAMSQLAKFTYQKIGSLQFVEGSRYNLTISPNIGPINIIDEEAAMEQLDSEVDTGTGAVFKNIGPFTSSQEYITALLDAQPPPDDSYSAGMQNLLRMIIRNLPLSRPMAGNERFELSHPNFSGQNFLASEDGTLTAIIDWDDVHTVPAWIGCCAYPAWLTRDWDPLMYGYGDPDCKDENSPEELDKYRKYYAAKMASLGSAKFTTKSDIHEAVCIAASSPLCIYHIVDKTFHHMFPWSESGNGHSSDDLHLLEVTEALAGDGLKKEVEERLLRKIQDLLSLPDDTPTDVVSVPVARGAKLLKFIGKWTGALISSFCAFLLPRRTSSAIQKWPGIINFLRGRHVKTNVSTV
ncbi:hypothetical protein DFP73DRAFT_633757 [Morchella snyderi]|nr:hypothetical protein DFP73DRAFT_633757 [Morchella snyderi]